MPHNLAEHSYPANHSALEQAADELMPLDPSRRRKTFGEKKFDFYNYAGFALVGNEILGTAITTWAEKCRWYTQKFVPFFTKYKDNPRVPHYASSGRLPMILVALISGNFMVPLIKHYEDRKSEIVRKFDKKHYGERALSDPEIVQAHKDMDEAPKQSWGSLWKGRIVTALFAIGVDFLVGSNEAPTTKLFKNNKTYQRFSSYTRISQEVAEGAASVAEYITKSFNTSLPNKASFIGWAKRGTELFTLSTLLTILFYTTSKLFARKRDERIERKYEELHGNDNTRHEPAGRARPSEQITDATLPSISVGSPKTQVVNIQRNTAMALPAPSHIQRI